MQSAMMQLQRMTGEDLAKWWKEYVRQLAGLLLATDREGQLSKETLQRITTLTGEQLALMRHVWVSSHDSYERFQVRNDAVPLLTALYGLCLLCPYHQPA